MKYYEFHSVPLVACPPVDLQNQRCKSKLISDDNACVGETVLPAEALVGKPPVAHKTIFTSLISTITLIQKHFGLLYTHLKKITEIKIHVSNIGKTFERLKSEGRSAFIPFFAAGDPDLATTIDLIKAAASSGADIIEIGVPFSDPIADGPVIQAAFYRALEKGFRVQHLFDLASELRKSGVTTPLVCMVSQTLVFKRTTSQFFADARQAGFDGMIIPDLPVGYEGDTATQAAAAGLDLIFLIAPTTPPDRRDLIAKLSRGFIYYVSVTGITGARMTLPADLAENVADIRKRTQTPVCVGFGISQAEQAQAVGAIADGVIVGSALVRKIEEALAKGLSGAAMVEHVNALQKELARSTTKKCK